MTPSAVRRYNAAAIFVRMQDEAAKNDPKERQERFVRVLSSAWRRRREEAGLDKIYMALPAGLKATIEVNSSKSENLGQVLPGIEHTCPGVPSLFHKLGDRLNGEIGGVDLVQFIPANGE